MQTDDRELNQERDDGGEEEGGGDNVSTETEEIVGESRRTSGCVGLQWRENWIVKLFTFEKQMSAARVGSASLERRKITMVSKGQRLRLHLMDCS
jgi:hypothetical protein